MLIEVTREALEAMKGVASRAYPREACGILLGNHATITRFVETANVHPSPATRFEIDPQALIDVHRIARAGGEQVAGYFHSHPAGPAEPSATDTALAARDGAIWAIAGSEGDLRFWRDGKTGFAPLPYSVNNG